MSEQISPEAREAAIQEIKAQTNPYGYYVQALLDSIHRQRAELAAKERVSVSALEAARRINYSAQEEMLNDGDLARAIQWAIDDSLREQLRAKDARNNALEFENDKLLETNERLKGELERVKRELSDNIFEWCIDCNSPLSQCGPESPDGEPTLDCKVCQLRSQLEAVTRERDGMRDYYANLYRGLGVLTQIELMAERDSLRARVGELEAAIKAPLRRASLGCPLMILGEEINAMKAALTPPTV